MYGRRHRTIGLTLIETTLVVATMALLVGLALPAVKALVHSFQTESGVRSMIGAALNSARTMAVSRQRYVGVRFQKRCTSNDPLDPLKGLLDAPQYMIFIMHDPQHTNLDNGFRAIEGLEPIKLPDLIGVLDLSPGDLARVSGKLAGGLSGATTFSIIFAPSGRLIVHDVRIRNRDGVYQPRNDPASTKVSYDDVFNSVDNICLYKEGIFIQDDYSLVNPSRDGIELGLGEEPSVTNFVIYDAALVRTLYGAHTGPDPDLANYLNTLRTQKSIHVSSYTGQLISSD